jgi:hypothetical protein
MKTFIVRLLLFVCFSNTIIAREQKERSGYPSVPLFLPIETKSVAFDADTLRVTPFTLKFNESGFPREVRSSDNELFKDLSVSVSSTSDQKLLQWSNPLKSLDNRGFFLRASGSSSLRFDTTTILSFEGYTELMRNSRRLAFYSRYIYQTSSELTFSYRFTVPSEYQEIQCENDEGVVSYNKEKLSDDIPMNGERSSIQFISSRTKTGFGIFFSPKDPEVREWFASDYLIRQKPARKLRFVRDNNDQLIMELTVGPVRATQGETLDQYFVIASFENGDNKLIHYIKPELANYYGRYFPHEGYSTNWYSPAEGYTQVHENGYKWGFSTYANSFMKFFLQQSSDSLHKYFWDEMVRHFNYFIERQSKYGLLPFRLLPQYLIDQTKEKNKIFTDFMFAQAGVGDIDFAGKLLPVLPEEEANVIYLRLARLKTLYDPEETKSWTMRLPSGAYWFEYSNLWKAEGYNNFIINTHVTALRVAVHMEAIAQHFGKSGDSGFWDNIVRKGTDGLLWFLQDEHNWTTRPDGTFELAYKKGGSPVREYHKFTIEELRYLLNSGYLTYKKNNILEALKRNLH